MTVPVESRHEEGWILIDGLSGHPLPALLAGALGEGEP